MNSQQHVLIVAKKGEEDSNGELKTCTACKMVKYCSRDCQKAHRPQHKKECRKRAAELHDEALFRQPPQKEDCPICMIPMAVNGDATDVFKSCCGNFICIGCSHAMKMEAKNQKVPAIPSSHSSTPCQRVAAS